MDNLLVKKELNRDISQAELLDDIDRMFEVLKHAYAMYEYFGEDTFKQAQLNIKERLTTHIFSAPNNKNSISQIDPDFKNILQIIKKRKF